MREQWEHESGNRLKAGKFLLGMGALSGVLGAIFSSLLADGLYNQQVQAYLTLTAILLACGGYFRFRERGMLRRDQRNDTRLISKAPGGRLLAVVEYLYSPKTVEEVFEQIVADWRTEYFDALKEGKHGKAAWVKARYVFRFIMAMGLSRALSVIRSMARR